ncbi:MAG: hypothetical protein WC809_18800 [Sinimarinibacterium sp.]|jgi:hypothetical protein
MADKWRSDVDNKLNNLDDGQRHVIGRLDQQDDMLHQGALIQKQLLDETVEVRKIVSRTRLTKRFVTAFFRCLASVAAWCMRTLHVFAKWAAPIAALMAALWALAWSYLHGGRPPTG